MKHECDHIIQWFFPCSLWSKRK